MDVHTTTTTTATATITTVATFDRDVCSLDSTRQWRHSFLLFLVPPAVALFTQTTSSDLSSANVLLMLCFYSFRVLITTVFWRHSFFYVIRDYISPCIMSRETSNSVTIRLHDVCSASAFFSRYFVIPVKGRALNITPQETNESFAAKNICLIEAKWQYLLSYWWKFVTSVTSAALVIVFLRRAEEFTRNYVALDCEHAITSLLRAGDACDIASLKLFQIRGHQKFMVLPNFWRNLTIRAFVVQFMYICCFQ